MQTSDDISRSLHSGMLRRAILLSSVDLQIQKIAITVLYVHHTRLFTNTMRVHYHHLIYFKVARTAISPLNWFTNKTAK